MQSHGCTVRSALKPERPPGRGAIDYLLPHGVAILIRARLSAAFSGDATMPCNSPTIAVANAALPEPYFGSMFHEIRDA